MTVLGILAITVIACFCYMPGSPTSPNESVGAESNTNNSLAQLEAEIEAVENNKSTEEKDKEKDNNLVELTATIANKGCTDITFDAYFIINGQKINDSIQTINITAGGQTDFTYSYIQEGTEDITYSISTDDILILSASNFDKRDTFHTLGSNYSLLTVALVSTPAFLVMLLVYLFCTRKPRKSRKRR
ncbi:MAG: hypothetical protein MJY64_00135 [archaeon]|nr:hypothetical protein [archaeon]